MSCQHSQLVHAYHDGELPAERRAAVEAHLGDCAECRELLDDLRRLSHLLGAVDLPDMPQRTLNRMHGSWWAAQNAKDRGVRHLAGWLTAAAAAVLIILPLRSGPASSSTEEVGAAWDAAIALVPPVEPRDDPTPELVQLAQWMANDLSVDQRR